jgi:hypothetical protein
MTARLRIRKDPDAALWDGDYLPWEIDFMEPKRPNDPHHTPHSLDTHDRTWSGSLAYATFAEAVAHIDEERRWCIERITQDGDHWYGILAELYGTTEQHMRNALHPTTTPDTKHSARRSEDIDR